MRAAVRAVIPFTLLCLCVFAYAGPSADNLENTDWNAKKAPVATAPALKGDLAKEWTEAAAKKPSKSCDQADVWRVLPTSKITAVVMKEIKVPVKGAFDRFVGYVFTDKKTGEFRGGEGLVDLSSYNSGVEVRDRRVQRFVFDVEKKGESVAKVDFSFGKGLTVPKKDKDKTNGEVDADIAMNGGKFKANFPLKLTRVSAKSAQLVSDRDGTFTYVTDDSKKRMLEMMKECNHHFLSTFVNVGLNLTLENTCAK